MTTYTVELTEAEVAVLAEALSAQLTNLAKQVTAAAGHPDRQLAADIRRREVLRLYNAIEPLPRVAAAEAAVAALDLDAILKDAR